MREVKEGADSGERVEELLPAKMPWEEITLSTSEMTSTASKRFRAEAPESPAPEVENPISTMEVQGALAPRGSASLGRAAQLASKRFRAGAVAAVVARSLAGAASPKEANAAAATNVGDNKSLKAPPRLPTTASWAANAGLGSSGSVRSLFASADRDDSGELEFDEFCNMTCNNGLAHDDLVDIFQVLSLYAWSGQVFSLSLSL